MQRLKRSEALFDRRTDWGADFDPFRKKINRVHPRIGKMIALHSIRSRLSEKPCLKAKTEAILSLGIHRLTLRWLNTIRKCGYPSPGAGGDFRSPRQRLAAILRSPAFALANTECGC